METPTTPGAGVFEDQGEEEGAGVLYVFGKNEVVGFLKRPEEGAAVEVAVLLNRPGPEAAGLLNMLPIVEVAGLPKRDPEAFVLGPKIPGDGGY